MIWRARNHEWDLRKRSLIMGILNVTPDSFSDGGRFVDVDKAVDHAVQMIADGADIIDVGGESTRPGAEPVSAADEEQRVCPVIRALRAAKPDIAISIDTFKASVAEAAISAGADIINDVTGLTGDPNMLQITSASKAGVVIMHMKGEPRTMQVKPTYKDLLQEIVAFLDTQCNRALAAGIDLKHLAFDPGIGFGKDLGHNLKILKNLDTFALRNRPVLLGVSRKSFIGHILHTQSLPLRHWPSVALTSYAIESGVRILRVHDVQANAQAARMTEAILGMAS